MRSSCICAALVAIAAAPATAASRPGSAWERPALTSPQTVLLGPETTNLVLDQRRDYVLRIPVDAKPLRSAVSIWGGHNVVIDGGTLRIAGRAGGMFLKNQMGTAWIHDLHIAGSRLTEGIDLQEPMPGATVVLRDVLIDTVHGSYATNHADLIQTWAGPARLLIDGFTGTTSYQGFFLLPNQWYRGPAPTIFDLRHVDIDNNGGYALWRSSGGWPLHLENVYVRPNPAKLWPGWWLWPKPSTGDRSWAGVIAGTPPGGHFVTARRTGARGVDESLTPRPLLGETT